MRIGRVLVVDGDENTRTAATQLLLSSCRQSFDFASNLVEAVELLKHSNYVCIFTALELPAIAGAPPRRQDLENLLDEVEMIKGFFKPPIVCLYARPTDMDDDAWTSWTSDMALKGVVKWVKRPYPSSGRTPDRMLKKILNGHYVRVVKVKPLTAAELMAAPLNGHDTPDAAVRLRDDGASDAPMVVAGKLPALDDVAIAAKLKKVFAGKGIGKDGLLAGLRQEDGQAEPPAANAVYAPEPALQSTSDRAAAASSSDNRWKDVPNEPISLDDFMAKFCQSRGKENRLSRKRALLAAARHKTVTLPPLAGGHKHGMPNRYLVQDLLAAWQSFLDEGVDLPPLLMEGSRPSGEVPGERLD